MKRKFTKILYEWTKNRINKIVLYGRPAEKLTKDDVLRTRFKRESRDKLVLLMLFMTELYGCGYKIVRTSDLEWMRSANQLIGRLECENRRLK